jgi:ornithine cyclodeaminase/alanine dehydrogenase-like protein (mu-crystallin family)
MPVNQNRKSAAEIVKGNLQVLTLSEVQVEQLLDLNALLIYLEKGFKALSRGDVQAPGRPEISIPGKGFILSMPAYQTGMQVSVKMVSVFEGNLSLNLPNHLAVINLFDSETGKPVCIMDGTYITAIRTSASAVLSAKLLSKTDSKIATILGAGVQGREHLKLLPLVRNLEKIFIGSLYFDDAKKLAEAHEEAIAIDDFKAAVRQSDIVCLCSHSYNPIIEIDWLKPGVHISSVGYAPPEGELPRELAQIHSLFIESRDAFEQPPVGCGELAGLDPDSGTELGEVLLGMRPGRQSNSEITVYKAMGIAMEDMIAANLAYQRAIQEGVGTYIVL